MRKVSLFRLFWRYIVPIVVLVTVMIESVSWGFTLMNTPDDLAVLGGFLLVLFGIIVPGVWITRILFKGEK